MQNSNLTALAALRNLRGKVVEDIRNTAKPAFGQANSTISGQDHFIVIGPENVRQSASDNETDVPATIHR